MAKLGRNKLNELLAKYEQGICNDQELEILYEWFDNRPIIDDLTFISEQERETIKDRLKQRIFKDIEETKVIKLNVAWYKKTLYQSIAATLFVLMSISIMIYYINKENNLQITFSVPKGKKNSMVKLEDGSQIWLSGGSTIKYPKSFDDKERIVELVNGLAFFEVKHNDKLPFTVKTSDGISAKVLGTSFTVQAYKNLHQIQVSVATGAVQVSHDDDKLEILKPGEQIVYSTIGNTYQKNKIDLTAISAWRNGSITFTRAGFDEVAATLSNLYNVQFHYDQKSTQNCRYNFNFSTDYTLIEVLDLLKSISETRYKLDHNQVYITGNNCL